MEDIKELIQMSEVKAYPRFRAVFSPIMRAAPHICIGDNGSQDYIVQYKKHWWSRWKVINKLGIPMRFSKKELDMLTRPEDERGVKSGLKEG